MSKKRVIVKRLNAIQNFGARDVLCTDKTGTLTKDRIILKRHIDIRGNDSEHGHCHGDSGLRPRWRSSSQGDDENHMHYYNGARTHLSLDKDLPVTRAVQAVGRILPKPILGGLHHQYVRI